MDNGMNPTPTPRRPSFLWKAGSLALALGLAAAGSAQADSKLNELKKRKMDLDQAAAKCAAMDEPDRSDCMAKRQKKVDKYKADLSDYKEDLAKEQIRNSERESKAAPADMNTRIQSRENS